ncbi:hypothetical protein MPH_09273 [Macrophomina phaseolina MS6]|uniref:Uncharacterized protein n=1 Tax=Macrophomina phaseolina (strain MS6) TaxID=1126212 RepID=K2RLB3_MACPH|nr:hypothetical protein MPH_09273 [Macrophomina phaseolina MS6]
MKCPGSSSAHPCPSLPRPAFSPVDNRESYYSIPSLLHRLAYQCTPLFFLFFFAQSLPYFHLTYIMKSFVSTFLFTALGVSSLVLAAPATQPESEDVQPSLLSDVGNAVKDTRESVDGVVGSTLAGATGIREWSSPVPE